MSDKDCPHCLAARPVEVSLRQLAEDLSMACTEGYEADVEYLAKTYPQGLKIIGEK